MGELPPAIDDKVAFNVSRRGHYWKVGDRGFATPGTGAGFQRDPRYLFEAKTPLHLTIVDSRFFPRGCSILLLNQVP